MADSRREKNLGVGTNFSLGKSKAPRSELMDELNRKRALVLSATALEFRD